MTQYTLRSWFQEIERLLSTGEGGEAVRLVQAGADVVAGLPSRQRLHTLGTLSQLFERYDRLADAVRFADQLIQLAKQLEPDGLLTARDYVVLGRLYERLDLPADQESALSNALQVFERLSAADRSRLQPKEVVDVQAARDRAARMAAWRRDTPRPPSDAKELLAVVLRTLEKEIPRLTQFPKLVVQQLYNESLVFQGQPLIDELRESFRHHLRESKQGWVELKRVNGPGQHAWRIARTVRTTEFPENLLRFVALPGECLLAVTRSGSTWLSGVSHLPRQVALPSPPRSNRCHLAALGTVVGYIDQDDRICFVQVVRDQLLATGDTTPGVAVLIAVPSGFVAAGEDGTIYRFDAEGRRTLVVASLGLTKPEHLAASADGQRVLLAKNLDVPVGLKALLRVIDLEQARIAGDREVDFDVRAAITPEAGRQFLLGTMMGVTIWDHPWDSAPKEGIRTGTTDQLVFSPDYRYMGYAGGYIILNDFELGLRASVGPLGDAFSIGQIIWAGIGENAVLHVAAGSLIASWRVADLPWGGQRRGAAIEVALFDEDGEHFAGVGIGGEKFFWKVDTGSLLEFEKGGSQATPYVTWCPGRRHGAICRRDRVEILDADGAACGAIPEDTPAAACWDGEGTTLAYVCTFDHDIRVVTFHHSEATLARLSCPDDYNPCAVTLSPDGQFLAVVEAQLRMPVNYGLTGLGANIKTNNPFGTEERIAVFDLQTGERRCLLERHKQQLMGLRFLAENHLLAWDAEGAVFVIELTHGSVVARSWAQARCVGIKQFEQEVLLADSGEGVAHSPVVYRLKFHNLWEE